MAASKLVRKVKEDASHDEEKPKERPEHAVISTFDLFSIGGESRSSISLESTKLTLGMHSWTQ